MQLKRKLLTWGSALLLGWGAFASNGNLGENQALAKANAKETPAHCEQVTKKHKTKLEGEYWGLKDGCLDKFKQGNIEDNFECIDSFLKEYPEDTCSRNELYNDSIEALLKNLHTKNRVTKSKIRSSLKREGILDYRKQLDELVDAAKLTKEKIKRSEKVFNYLNPIAKRESIKRVESWKNYLKYLRIEATVVADLALYLREKPSVTSTERINTERVKGIVRSYSALNNLAALKLHLSNNDWYMVVDDFRQWKRDHTKVYQRFLKILNTSLDHGSFKTGEGKAWKPIVYSDSQGNWKKGWATKDFEKEWGDNGENFYEKIETIDDAIKETKNVTLTQNIMGPDGTPMLDGICDKKLKNDPDCVGMDSDEQVKNKQVKPNTTKKTKQQPRDSVWDNLSTCPNVDLSKPENVLLAYHQRLKGYFEGKCSRKDLSDVVHPRNSYRIFELFSDPKFKGIENYNAIVKPVFKYKTGIPGVDKFYRIPYRKQVEVNMDLILEDNRRISCNYPVYTEKLGNDWKLRLSKFKGSCK